MKNLPFQLKQEEFHEILVRCAVAALMAGASADDAQNTFDPKPAHLKYHLDNGQFRGIAFIKCASALAPLHSLGLTRTGTAQWRRLRSSTTSSSRSRSVVAAFAASTSASSWQAVRPRTECPCAWTVFTRCADLDLDDDEAKALWEQLNRFKESTQTELPFPTTLTSLQRKQIHYFADRLGLIHFSQVRSQIRPFVPSAHHTQQGEGEARFIVVTKRRERQPQGSNTVGLQPADDKSWRARNQEEKKKAAQEPTLRIQPVRQPKGPEPGKGFSDVRRTHQRA